MYYSNIDDNFSSSSIVCVARVRVCLCTVRAISGMMKELQGKRKASLKQQSRDDALACLKQLDSCFTAWLKVSVRSRGTC